VVAALTASVGSAGAHLIGAPTRLVVYSPFTMSGTLTRGLKVTARVSGYCWEGSIVDERADAWRCFRGNYILDPCFSGTGVSSWVTCPTGALFGRDVLRLDLTKPLPASLANKDGDPTTRDPWAVELTTGVTCTSESGATGTVAGMRLNYACSNHGWLVGDPRRGSSTWTIFYAPNLSSRKLLTAQIAVAYW
jgi:hypothetical protein